MKILNDKQYILEQLKEKDSNIIKKLFDEGLLFPEPDELSWLVSVMESSSLNGILINLHFSLFFCFLLSFLLLLSPFAELVIG